MKKFFLLILLIIICGVVSTILLLNFKSILSQKQQIPFQKVVLLRDEKILVFDPSSKELKEIAKLTDFIEPAPTIHWKDEWGRSRGSLVDEWSHIDYQIVSDRFFFYSAKEDASASISLKNGQFTVYPHQGFSLISPNGKEAVWFRDVTPESEAGVFLKDKTEFYKSDIELWHGDLDNKKAELIYKTTIPEIWVDASPLVSAFLWQNNDVYFVLGSIWSSPGATGSCFKINLLTKEVEKIPFDYFYYFDEQRRIIIEAEEIKGEWRGASPVNNRLVLEGFDKEPIKIRMRNTAGGIDFSTMVVVSPDKKKILFYAKDIDSDYYSLVLYDISQNISKIIVDDVKNEWSKDWWIRNIKFISNEIIVVNLEKTDWNGKKTLFIDTFGKELFEIPDAWFLGSTSF